MSNVSSDMEDPIWEYTLALKLQPYLPAVRRWWQGYENMKITSTGVSDIHYEDIECPPGLFMRMTNTAVRSPIKHVQAFPFVPSSYLQIIGVPGGVNRMIERVCHDNKFKLEEFVIIEKHNLPSTYQKGQLLCFVPAVVLEGAQQMGKYVYMTVLELIQMAQGQLPDTVMAKCGQYIK